MNHCKVYSSQNMFHQLLLWVEWCPQIYKYLLEKRAVLTTYHSQPFFHSRRSQAYLKSVLPQLSSDLWEYQTTTQVQIFEHFHLLCEHKSNKNSAHKQSLHKIVFLVTEAAFALTNSSKPHLFYPFSFRHDPNTQLHFLRF